MKFINLQSHLSTTLNYDSQLKVLEENNRNMSAEIYFSGIMKSSHKKDATNEKRRSSKRSSIAHTVKQSTEKVPMAKLIAP